MLLLHRERPDLLAQYEAVLQSFLGGKNGGGEAGAAQQRDGNGAVGAADAAVTTAAAGGAGAEVGTGPGAAPVATAVGGAAATTQQQPQQQNAEQGLPESGRARAPARAGGGAPSDAVKPDAGDDEDDARRLLLCQRLLDAKAKLAVLAGGGAGPHA
jgi:hypothetical protein